MGDAPYPIHKFSLGILVNFLFFCISVGVLACLHFLVVSLVSTKCREKGMHVFYGYIPGNLNSFVSELLQQ